MHQQESRLSYYINHNVQPALNASPLFSYEYNLYLRTIVLAYSLSIFPLKCKSTDQEDKEDEWYQK